MNLQELEIVQEFEKIMNSKNPKIAIETQFIWVLSSRHTVNLEHLNCVKVSQNFTPNPYDANDDMGEKECDVEDDLLRINTAINIANKIIKRREKKNIKNHPPYIIYNGWPKQNIELKDSLNCSENPKDFEQSIISKDNLNLQTSNVNTYPKENFIIFEMPELYPNTIGQFMSFQEEINTNDLLKDLRDNSENLLIVTSAYHAPRVLRYFNTPAHGELLNHLENITLHLIDREGKRPCFERDVKGEKNRIKLYTEKGWLGDVKKVNFLENINVF